MTLHYVHLTTSNSSIWYMGLCTVIKGGMFATGKVVESLQLYTKQITQYLYKHLQ